MRVMNISKIERKRMAGTPGGGGGGGDNAAVSSQAGNTDNNKNISKDDRVTQYSFTYTLE